MIREKSHPLQVHRPTNEVRQIYAPSLTWPHKPWRMSAVARYRYIQTQANSHASTSCKFATATAPRANSE